VTKVQVFVTDVIWQPPLAGERVSTKFPAT